MINLFNALYALLTDVTNLVAAIGTLLSGAVTTLLADVTSLLGTTSTLLGAINAGVGGMVGNMSYLLTVTDILLGTLAGLIQGL